MAGDSGPRIGGDKVVDWRRSNSEEESNMVPYVQDVSRGGGNEQRQSVCSMFNVHRDRGRLGDSAGVEVDDG
jgi:hypothetical protein